MKKYVYLFSEGNKDMRNLLGGKGANLAEMTNIGLPVPQGFTVTTEACTRYYEDGKVIAKEIEDQVYEKLAELEKITGKRPTLVRPPYGSINENVKNTIDNPLILWNVDSLDWKSRDKEKIVPLVLNDVQDGDIILLHDIHSTTVPAVEEILKYLVENDYQVITVSQMLNAKGYDLTKTRVFYSARQ